jgi:hypothetical protein
MRWTPIYGLPTMREAVDAEVAARDATSDTRQMKEVLIRQVVSKLYTIWASAHVVTGSSSTGSNFEQFTPVMRELLCAAVQAIQLDTNRPRLDADDDDDVDDEDDDENNNSNSGVAPDTEDNTSHSNPGVAGDDTPQVAWKRQQNRNQRPHPASVSVQFSDSDIISYVKGSLRVRRDKYIAELIQSGNVSPIPTATDVLVTQLTKWFLGTFK